MNEHEETETDDTAGLDLEEFELLAEEERTARLVRQWRHGSADLERRLVLFRTVPEDALAMTIGEVTVALPEGITRPRAMWRAWARAQLACDAIRALRTLGLRIGLVPERGRWEVIADSAGESLSFEELPQRRPERALRAVDRYLRSVVADEARRIEAARTERARGDGPAPEQPAKAEPSSDEAEAAGSSEGAGDKEADSTTTVQNEEPASGAPTQEQGS